MTGILKKSNLDTGINSGKIIWRHENIAIYKPKEEASEETNPAEILN